MFSYFTLKKIKTMVLLMKHPLSWKYRTLFNNNGMNTFFRLVHFFAQAHHESNLKPKVESFNYSVAGILNTFGRHRITATQAQKYARSTGKAADQQTLANIVYGGEWGRINLGNRVYGDGWKYRGRGIFQITGLSNYQRLSKATGIDFVNNPDLLLIEANSIIAALWYWNDRNMNRYADEDNTLAVSRVINIGSNKSGTTPNHYKERKELTAYYKIKFRP